MIEKKYAGVYFLTLCLELLSMARYCRKKVSKLGSIAELGAFDGNFIVFGNIMFPVLAADWLH